MLIYRARAEGGGHLPWNGGRLPSRKGKRLSSIAPQTMNEWHVREAPPPSGAHLQDAARSMMRAHTSVGSGGMTRREARREDSAAAARAARSAAADACHSSHQSAWGAKGPTPPAAAIMPQQQRRPPTHIMKRGGMGRGEGVRGCSNYRQLRGALP